MSAAKYNTRYRSKFLSRYIFRLEKRGLIEVTGEDSCALTSVGLLVVELLGSLKMSEISKGKIACIRALDEPKTNKQLQKILDVSRTFVSILLRQLKEADIVKTERMKYRLKENNVPPETLKELPNYLLKIINVFIDKNPVNAEEIAEITELAEKTVQARISELSRMQPPLVERAGPCPVPEDFFVVYYKLTPKGEKILEKLDKFVRLIEFLRAIQNTALCENGTATEEEIWRYLSDQLNYRVNTFEVREVINLLKRRGGLKGNKIAGYSKKGEIVYLKDLKESDLFFGVNDTKIDEEVS